MDADSIPVSIEDAETVARAIFHPYHIKKGNLKPAAFRPPPERTDVSVMRHNHMGDSRCKLKAKEMANDNKKFKGFAIIGAINVRECEADVVDSRDQFIGHADILHSIPAPPKHNPLPSSYIDILKKLADKANFIDDPDPTSDEWKGEKLY